MTIITLGIDPVVRVMSETRKLIRLDVLSATVEVNVFCTCLYTFT